MIRPLRLALPALLLAGCAARDDGGYPSLAVRPAEKLGFAEPEAPAPAPLAPDPALDARAAAFRTRLATVATGFDRAAAAADRAARVRGAKSAGSEPWLLAQSALAELDDWRAQAGSIAADIDAAVVARAAAGAAPYPALAAAADAARAESDRQTKAIDRLQALTPRG